MKYIDYKSSSHDYYRRGHILIQCEDLKFSNLLTNDLATAELTERSETCSAIYIRPRILQLNPTSKRMQQPSVADYFLPKKRIREVEHLNKSSDADGINTLAVESRHTAHTPVDEGNAGVQFPKLPPLTPFGSPSKSLDALEVCRRVSLGPPRLTPIKNGVPVSVLPSSPNRRGLTNGPSIIPGNISADVDQIGINTHETLGSYQESSHSKVKFSHVQEIKCSSPGKLSAIRGSPVKNAPSFMGKSVVKRLFCLDNDEETKNSLIGTREGPDVSAQNLPAFQRFAHLVTPTLPPGQANSELEHSNDTDVYPDTLPLPYMYNVLLEIFRAVETVVSLLFNRKEIITLRKLKSKVSHLLPRPPLQKSHLAQILNVLPNSYDLSYEPMDLILRPNFICTSNSIPVSCMTSEVLMERRDKFLQSLIKICHKHHGNFLESQNPPIKIPMNKKITQWHPNFPLNEVPGIEVSPLLHLDLSDRDASSYFPKKDTPSHSVPSSTKTEIGRAKLKLMELSKRNLKLKTIVLKSHRGGLSRDKSIGAIQGVSNKLLERIRLRERMKTIRCMTLTPEEGRDREMLSRLPTYVRMIRNVLLVEKKAVIPMHLLVDRLIHSQQIVSNQRTVEGHLKLIEKLVPEWLQILKGTNGSYVKIDMDVEINGIVEQVKILIRKAGNVS